MWSPTSDSRLNSLRYKQTNTQNHIKDYMAAYILTIYLSLNSYMRTCQHTHTHVYAYLRPLEYTPWQILFADMRIGSRAEQ